MKRTVAAIFAISILGAAMFLAHAYKTRGDRAGNISVTGLGSIDFESDVISWSGITRPLTKIWLVVLKPFAGTGK